MRVMNKPGQHWQGCFAHARRKFIEVQRAQVKGKTGKADWAISHIRKLYRIEGEIKDKWPGRKTSATPGNGESHC